MMKQTLLVFALLISAAIFAQSPDKSAKLVKEQGFNILKVGALLSEVKSVLQADTIDRETSLEPKAQNISYTDKIYLVDLKSPGYSLFAGKKVARIEVWFQKHYDSEGEKTADFEIAEVKIYFKTVSATDTEAFLKKLVLLYDDPPSLGIDVPEKGDDTVTWFSPLVLMNFTSYYGDWANEQIKRDYLKISFESAVGG